MTNTAPPSTAPSRHDNPFATCWTRPGALAYQFPEGESAERLVALLAEQQWRGAIIGPHGSGKSTLLEALLPHLRSAVESVVRVTLRNGQCRLPMEVWARGRKSRLMIIDGYEQLSWLERARLHRRCRRGSIGLLVTSHVVSDVPTLIRLSPDRALVERVVADLTARVSSRISFNDVAASYACHGGNVREILFDLYDRHERLRSGAPSPCCPSR